MCRNIDERRSSMIDRRNYTEMVELKIKRTFQSVLCANRMIWCTMVSFHFQYRLVMLYIVENPTDIRKSIETIGCVQLIHNVIKTILTLLLLLRKVCVCFEKRRTSSFSSWWQTFERNSFEYNSSWDHHNLWTMSRWVENP